MEAKLYGQNKGGMSINGIIKDYYAYAGENISAGDLVEFVEGIAATSTEIVDTTDTKIHSDSYAGYGISAVSLDQNRVFIAHGYGSNKYLYGMVVTIKGTEIVCGADVAISTTANSSVDITSVLLNEQTVFVVHSSSSSYYLYGARCNINGDVVTVAMDASISSSSGRGYDISATKVDTNKVLVLHGTGSTESSSAKTKLYGIVVTVSESSLSKGSDTQIDSSNYTGGYHNCVTLASGKVFEIHRSGSAGYYRAKVLSVSGTTISVSLSNSGINNGTYAGSYKSPIVILNGSTAEDTYVFIPHNNTDSYRLYGIVVRITSSAITSGTDTLISSTSYSGYCKSAVLLKNGKILVSCSGGGSYALSAIVATVSGLVPSTGTMTTLTSTANSGRYISSSLLDDGTICVFHNFNTSNYYLYCWHISEENGVPVKEVLDTKYLYETQVRQVTTGQFDSIAKTSGEGGDDTGHKDLVSIWTRPDNLVKNGDFENVIEGWVSDGGTEYSTFTQADNGYSGKCGKMEVINVYDIGTETYSVNETWDYSISFIEGHIYYLSVFVKGKASNSTSFGGTVAIQKESGSYNWADITSDIVTSEEWNQIAYWTKANESAENGKVRISIRVGHPDNSISVGMGMYFDNLKLYDLTAEFGTGNEPTKEWCDANL